MKTSSLVHLREMLDDSATRRVLKDVYVGKHNMLETLTSWRELIFFLTTSHGVLYPLVRDASVNGFAAVKTIINKAQKVQPSLSKKVPPCFCALAFAKAFNIGLTTYRGLIVFRITRPEMSTRLVSGSFLLPIVVANKMNEHRESIYQEFKGRLEREFKSSNAVSLVWQNIPNVSITSNRGRHKPVRVRFRESPRKVWSVPKKVRRDFETRFIGFSRILKSRIGREPQTPFAGIRIYKGD